MSASASTGEVCMLASACIGGVCMSASQLSPVVFDLMLLLLSPPGYHDWNDNST